MKLGLEVEGKHKGLSTFFIDETELDLFISNITNLLEEHLKTRHLYITAEDPNNTLINKLSKLVPYLYITLEVKNINFTVPADIHIMYNIETPGVWVLKETDSIKFHNPEDQVLSTSLETMFFTHPEAFLNDIILDVE